MSNSTTMESLKMSNPVFECYAFYGSILILKMIAMSFLIAFRRMRKRMFLSPEDVVVRRGAEIKNDPDIERIRRAHLNDLENIPIFLITGLLLVVSNPPEMLANNLFRIYTLVRIMHTISYAVLVLPQPTKVICFISGVVVNIIMIVCVILNMHHL